MNLTFAEAMALDPSEVEVCQCPEDGLGEWLNLAKSKWLTLAQLRTRRFRRVPKRSRVQEMAEAHMCCACKEEMRATVEKVQDEHRKCDDQWREKVKSEQATIARLTRELAEARKPFTVTWGPNGWTWSR